MGENVFSTNNMNINILFIYARFLQLWLRKCETILTMVGVYVNNYTRSVDSHVCVDISKCDISHTNVKKVFSKKELQNLY